MKEFRGVFPIVITPFHEDGSLDLDSQRRVVRFLVESGAHGLGLFANASEGYTLSNSERSELLKLVIHEVGGRVPIIVSTGHTGTDVATILSREAEDAGADGLMVLPPYYMRPDSNGIYEYYRAISGSVRIPIMVQDAPLMTQVTMGPTLLASLARDIEHVGYVKVEAPPTGPKISEVVSLAGESLKVFGGLNGHFFMEEMNRGACGTMPGSDMVAMFVRVWNLYRQGDKHQARMEFNRYLPLIRYELQPGLGVSVMKHNLKESGVITSARVRHPTRSIDDVGVDEIRQLLVDISQMPSESQSEASASNLIK